METVDGLHWALLMAALVLGLDQDEHQSGLMIRGGPVNPLWKPALPPLALASLRLNLETDDSMCLPDSPVYLLLYVNFISGKECVDFNAWNASLL